MSQNAPLPLNAEAGGTFTACKNCHSPMPSGLRFCRNCGYRLGEGPAEYTETIRFNGATAAGNVTTAMPPSNTSAFGMGAGPMATTVAGCSLKRRKKRMSGMTWMFLFMIMFFVVGGGASFFVRNIPRGINIGTPPAPAPPRSYFGVNQFTSTEGGVTFDTVDWPGTPADKAGLVGGDIVTSFDGQQVTSDDEMMDLLGKTPIGKTVDVIYIRDGETNTVKLTTMSKADYDQLGKVFRARPEGRGLLGYEPGDAERVEIQGTKLHGVRLGQILQSRPADLAALKNEDIVSQIDNPPIP